MVSNYCSLKWIFWAWIELPYHHKGHDITSSEVNFKGHISSHGHKSWDITSSEVNPKGHCHTQFYLGPFGLVPAVSGRCYLENWLKSLRTGCSLCTHVHVATLSFGYLYLEDEEANKSFQFLFRKLQFHIWTEINNMQAGKSSGETKHSGALGGHSLPGSRSPKHNPAWTCT